MMRGRKSKEDSVLMLLLILFVLLLYGVTRISSGPEIGMGGAGHRIFLEVCGEVEHPGVYGFSENPSLSELMERAVAKERVRGKPILSGCGPFASGTRVEISTVDGRVQGVCRPMSAFHKMTLGIPLALNRVSAEGLTALPGIGPKTAEAVILERNKRGGFSGLEDLLEVRGIGPRTYAGIEEFVTLEPAAAVYPSREGRNSLKISRSPAEDL